MALCRRVMHCDCVCVCVCVCVRVLSLRAVRAGIVARGAVRAVLR